MGGAARPRYVRMVTAWEPNPLRILERPDDSTTEVVFHNMDNTISKERIAALLGGGIKVRDVRRSGPLTFVAFWTPVFANDAMTYGLRKLRRAGVAVATIQRAKFREDLHLHEIDPTAPSPYYEPFSYKEETHEYGKRFAKAWMTERNSGGSASSSTSMQVTVKMESIPEEGKPKNKRGRLGSESD